MFKFLQHTIFALFFVICCSSAIYSNSSDDFCKYSDDPIIVNEENPRHLLVLSGTVNQLTFCDLEVGASYVVSGLSELDPTCSFQFGYSKSAFLINPSAEGNSEIAAAPKTQFEFVAQNECMDVLVSSVGCVGNEEHYPVIISIANLTIGPHFLRFLPRFAQPVHGGGKLGFGLRQLVGQFRFALLQIGDRLIAGLFSLVQLLAHTLQLVHVCLAHTFEPVDQPMGKPSQAEGDKEDDRGGDDELCSIHLGLGVLRGPSCRRRRRV